MRSVKRVEVTIDCADPDHAATFWETFLGYRRRTGGPGSTYVTVERPTGVDGPPVLNFQAVPEPKISKARVHLDLYVDHALPMVEAMVSAHATLIATTDAGDWTTHVLKDPAGNEFCVIGPD